MKCKKFDNWISNIPVKPRGYTKKSDDYPYLSVFVYANGKKRNTQREKPRGQPLLERV